MLPGVSVSQLLAEYALFLAKVFTLLLAAGLLIALAAGFARRGSEPGLTVERLNDRFEQMRLTIQRLSLDGRSFRRAVKAARRDSRARRKGRDASLRRRLFVLDFRGDLRASATAGLREEVSAILAACTDGDRVLVRLENAGGTVHDHGLAASQLTRLKAAGLELTVAVDRVAASGGYLMAATADRILAAPFAILGSIGVMAQLPNLHRWLQSRGVDFEQITAGRYKRTLTMFGENTEEGRQKLKDELEDVHELFKTEVARHREALDVESVATGEAWYGTRALELKLVDELRTSDDFLLEASRDHDLLLVRYQWKRRLPQRLAERAHALWHGTLDALAQRVWNDRYFR